MIQLKLPPLAAAAAAAAFWCLPPPHHHFMGLAWLERKGVCREEGEAVSTNQQDRIGFLPQENVHPVTLGWGCVQEKLRLYYESHK